MLVLTLRGISKNKWIPQNGSEDRIQKDFLRVAIYNYSFRASPCADQCVATFWKYSPDKSFATSLSWKAFEDIAGTGGNDLKWKKIIDLISILVFYVGYKPTRKRWPSSLRRCEWEFCGSHQGPSKGLHGPRWRGGGWCLPPRRVGAGVVYDIWIC